MKNKIFQFDGPGPHPAYQETAIFSIDIACRYIGRTLGRILAHSAAEDFEFMRFWPIFAQFFGHYRHKSNTKC